MKWLEIYSTCYAQNDLFTGKIEKLSFNQSKDDLFAYCKPLKDTTFTGIKKTTILEGNDTILIDIYYNKGKKLKVNGYFQNGKKYIESNFNGYNSEGRDFEYYKNGNKKLEIYTENGKARSTMEWYENGNIKTLSYYAESDNRLIIKQFYETGIPKEDNISLDSAEYGCSEYIAYNPDGTIFIKSIFNCGIQDIFLNYDSLRITAKGKIETALWSKVGKWTFFYANGSKMMEFSYEDSIPNVLNGKWNFYDQNGNLTMLRDYLHGKLVSEKVLKKNREKYYLIENKTYPFE